MDHNNFSQDQNLSFWFRRNLLGYYLIKTPIFFFLFTITLKAQLLKPDIHRYLPPKMGSTIPNLETVTLSGSTYPA
jgi:hypothetical protein